MNFIYVFRQKMFIYTFFVIFLCPFVTMAEKYDFSNMLEKSGIRYPEGFDINTVGEVRGIIKEIYMPQKGPMQFVLANRFDKYIVIIAPMWYVEDIQMNVIEGQEVLIKGSKGIGKDGNLYMLAQELKLIATGKSFIFRNQAGSPLWSGGAFKGAGSSTRRIGEGRLRGGFGGQGHR